MSERAEMGARAARMVDAFETACLRVPCSTCNSRQGEECRMGGEAWPAVAHHPHKARREDWMLIRWWDEFGRATVAPSATDAEREERE